MGRRGRPSKIDVKKISKIIGVLYKNPDGLWLRELSKNAGLHPSTVNLYIERSLKPLLIDERIGNDEKPLLRIIRLKPIVIQRLDQGQRLSDILKYIKLIEKIKN
ncbi:MAG: hypothetical protein J7J92_02065 [Candidatus Aenigmarchaeota archaeon]|nr:hypothetical protein [Candidatus Aenigmarchaeota archaeon]